MLTISRVDDAAKAAKDAIDAATTALDSAEGSWRQGLPQMSTQHQMLSQQLTKRCKIRDAKESS